MTLGLNNVEYKDLGGGLDLMSSPTKDAEDSSTASLNMDYTIDGAALTRNGSNILNKTNGIPTPITGSTTSFNLFRYENSDGVEKNFVHNGTAIYEDFTAPVVSLSGVAAAYSDYEFIVTSSEELGVFGDGVNPNKAFNGTSWVNLSLPRPAAPSAADTGAGGVTGGDYTFYYSYAVTSLGVVIKEGELSPVFSLPGVAAGRQITITVANSSDPQVNAKLLYVKNTTLGDIVRITTTPEIPDNTTTTFVFTIPNSALTTILAEFDNQASPISSIFETDDFGQTWFVSAARPSDVYVSKPYMPWICPEENIQISDGPVQCIKRCFGTLIFGTNKSLWVQNGPFETTEARRISSKIGILNNRCAKGESVLYIVTTTLKVYPITPTDFSQDEMRISEDLSYPITPLFTTVNTAHLDAVNMEYCVKAGSAKVFISVPTQLSTCDTIFIYNELQSNAKQKPVWQLWNNIKASCLKQIEDNGFIGLYSGDFNGYLWLLDDSTTNGDGAEENGTATGGSTTTLIDTSQLLITSTATAGGIATLTDSTLTGVTTNQYAGYYLHITGGTGSGQSKQIQSNTDDTPGPVVFTLYSNWVTVPDATSTYEVGGWNVNQFRGINVLFTSGTGAGQVGLITSNTVNTLTFNAVATAPDSTTEYSIGGYQNYHFTNWKSVFGSYDVLKQLWFLYYNANSNGSYTVDMILQYDFNALPSEEIVIPLVLSGNNAIWGDVIWGSFNWGSQSVFTSRVRKFARFKSMRVGFRNNIAGQPFQINAFSIAAQDKGLFFRSA